MTRRWFLQSFATTLLIASFFHSLRGQALSAVPSVTPQITVVDIMPESLSGEMADDSEPDVAVNPADPSQIAASALTRDPMGAVTAPIFVSTNGGQTWSCRSIVPSSFTTCDITLRFGTRSGVLYVSALRNHITIGSATPPPNEVLICKSAGFASARVMDKVFTRRGKGIDQPYIGVWTVAGADHVFVGDKDYNYRPTSTPNGLAAIDRSLDGVGGSFTPFSIESRDLYGDNCEVRPAATADGKVVYATFNHLTVKPTDNDATRTADVVVVRDDNGGASTSPFSSLKDPQDKVAGVRVKNRTFAWNKCLGGDRLGGDLAIAVHPTDPSKVYLVWSDFANNRISLHLNCSTDGGKSWSNNKRDIPDAKNPGLAINAKGAVGFLYQQVVKTSEGDMWLTQFERIADDFKGPPNPLILAKFPVSELPACASPDDGGLFLGDYLHLMSVGNDFYGIFPSCNVPDLSRFPYGANFQRLTKNGKLVDEKGNEVTRSIDPFFLKVTE